MVGSGPETRGMRNTARDRAELPAPPAHLPAPRDRLLTARGVLVGITLGLLAWVVLGLLLWMVL
jgi:hypothetical protein